MRSWQGNEHWMVRDGDPDPQRLPLGCDCCGYIDDERGVDGTDLLWSPGYYDREGGWLCMECD